MQQKLSELIQCLKDITKMLEAQMSPKLKKISFLTYS